MCVCSVHSGRRQAGIVLPPLAVLHGAIYFLLCGRWEEPGFENRVSGSGVTSGGSTGLGGPAVRPPAGGGVHTDYGASVRSLSQEAGGRPLVHAVGCLLGPGKRGGAAGTEAAGVRPIAAALGCAACAGRPCRCPHPAGLHPRAGAYVLGAFFSRSREPGTQSVGVLARLLPQGGRWAGLSTAPSPGLVLLFGDEKAAPRAAPALGQSRSCFWLSAPCLPTCHPPLSTSWTPVPGPA